MGELVREGHEAYARLRVQGLSQAESARRAGFGLNGSSTNKRDAAHNAGSRLERIPAIRARIAELKQAELTSGAGSALGIRTGLGRARAQEQRVFAMRTVIKERGEDPKMQTVPGGKTGLMVVSYKQIGSGENATLVEEYKVDIPLLNCLLAHESTIAEELGQKIKRSESTTSSVSLTMNDTDLHRALRSKFGELDPEQRKALAAIAPEIIDAVAESPQTVDEKTQSPESTTRGDDSIFDD